MISHSVRIAGDAESTDPTRMGRWPATLLLYYALMAVPASAVDLDIVGVASYQGPLSFGRLSISGTRLYSGGCILDISNPANPKQIRNYDASGWPYGLPVTTNFTYTPDPDETWLVTDISDPAHPLMLGGYKTMASASGYFRVKVSGSYAFVVEPGKFSR